MSSDHAEPRSEHDRFGFGIDTELVTSVEARPDRNRGGSPVPGREQTRSSEAAHPLVCGIDIEDATGEPEGRLLQQLVITDESGRRAGSRRC